MVWGGKVDSAISGEYGQLPLSRPPIPSVHPKSFIALVERPDTRLFVRITLGNRH
jgi:hypothetical protein